MLRFINICLVVTLVGLAYIIYDGKYEARALDEDIAGLRKDIETEQDAVAVLRAEWSLLNRPERIERLATKHLKLAPARPEQIVTLDRVSDRDFERVRAEPADDTLPTAMGPATKVKSVPVSGVASTPAAPANLDDDLPTATKTVKVKTVPIKESPIAKAASSAPVVSPPPVTVSPPQE
jgi:cell division protein FtsL